MFNNPYMMNYNPSINQQGFSERIDNEITRLQQMKEQMQKPVQQPTNLTQNFQLAPANSHTMRYANTIEDVSRENVYFDTPYFSKDMSVLWVKGVNGNIKTYELTEIVQKDERDLLIESLQMQVTELRKEIKENAKPINNDDDESNSSKKSSSISNARTSKKE